MEIIIEIENKQYKLIDRPDSDCPNCHLNDENLCDKIGNELAMELCRKNKVWQLCESQKQSTENSNRQ